MHQRLGSWPKRSTDGILGPLVTPLSRFTHPFLPHPKLFSLKLFGGASVEGPESKTPPRQKPAQETLVVGLDKNGGITLNRNPIDRTRLAEEITRQLEVRDKKVVFVDFDDDAKYGVAVEILDLAKASGAEVLGIMKNKDKKTPDTLRG